MDEIGSLAADQPGAEMARGDLHQLPGAQVRNSAQATIVNRLAFLDQSRFQQQGAEFSDRLMPVNAAHLLVLTQVGREVSPYALTQVDAFPHVQERVVVAVEQAHPGGFGQVVEQGRIEVRRQAGELVLLTDGLGRGSSPRSRFNRHQNCQSRWASARAPWRSPVVKG